MRSFLTSRLLFFNQCPPAGRPLSGPGKRADGWPGSDEGGERGLPLIIANKADPERQLLNSHQVIELINFSEYIGAALRRAKYESLENGSYVATT